MGAGVVNSGVKLLLVMLASYMQVQIQVLAVMLLIQPPANVNIPGKAEERSTRAWDPAIHMGDLAGVPGSSSAWHRPGCCSHLGNELEDGRLPKWLGSCHPCGRP